MNLHDFAWNRCAEHCYWTPNVRLAWVQFRSCVLTGLWKWSGVFNYLSHARGTGSCDVHLKLECLSFPKAIQQVGPIELGPVVFTLTTFFEIWACLDVVLMGFPFHYITTNSIL